MAIAINNFTCNISGNTVTVSNAFVNLANLNVINVTLLVGNVLNPSPAIYTGTFSGTIGTDIAVPRTTGVQLTPGIIPHKSRLFQHLQSNFFAQHSLQQHQHHERSPGPHQQPNSKQFHPDLIPSQLLDQRHQHPTPTHQFIDELHRTNLCNYFLI